MLLFTETITPRLQYITGFFSEQLFIEPIRLTTDAEEFKRYEGPAINYSANEFSEKEFFMKPVGILFENDIRKQPVECFELNFHKAFFGTRGDFPFDLFAAAFYLITRYEEYLPHEKDSYGRYAHTQSLAFREHFLQQPLVNIWLEDFKKTLQRKFPGIVFKHNQFRCLLTYDIDIAWSYKHKGFTRSIGGALKNIAQGNWAQLNKRWQVTSGKERDPYDCFEWLDALHLYCRIKPYYFFLVAKHTGKYDKNTSTGVRAFRDLIEYYANTYKVGIHPSWQSGDDDRLLKEEIEWMEVVVDKAIGLSRQHYIRFTLPTTFRKLIKAGIEKDFSMGYGSINGFRASVCSSYNWFDLEKNESTALRLYPFCFMDANSFFEQKYTTAQAYNELIQYYNDVKKYNGIFISIWHNNILGTDPQFNGWRELFELFMKETVYWDAYYDQDE